MPRRITQDLFTKSVSAVLAGDFWVSRAMVRTSSTCFATMRRRRKTRTAAPLRTANRLPELKTISPGSAWTPREMQIIGALVDGQTNKDIGNTFGISEYTVKHHLTNVYDKLGVYNRVELVLFAISHRLSAAPGAFAFPDAR